MSRRATPRRRRTGGIVVGAVAGVAVLGVVTSAVVFAQGYDAQHVQRQEAGVWVYRDAGQYARVDTDLRQIDTVRDAEDPRAILQNGSAGVVLTDGLRKRWTIDPSDPAALVSSGSGSGSTGAAPASATRQQVGENTPDGTREVVSSGAWSAYLTEAGKVYLARIGATGAAAAPVQIDPLQASGKASTASYAASAIAVTDDGEVVMYSAKEGAVRRYRASSSSFVGGAQAVPSAPRSDTDLLLTEVGGRWALAQAGHDRVWVEGHGAPLAVKVGADATAEQGSSTGDRAYFADADGLVEVALDDATVRRVGSGGGTPAAPVVVGGTVYAAWLGQASGRLWSSAGVDKTLTVADGALKNARSVSPVIQSNGQRAVLVETGTGLLWSVPDGTAIPLSQWTVDRDRTTQQAGTVKVPDVAEEEPPVAEADVFGVRSGSMVTLPVLLNDHDPNKRDVLTIDGSSLAAGLSDPGFGTLALAGDDQQIVVDVHAQAGTATFSYTVTDGQQSSPPATVTLHVVPDDQNQPPAWCAVDHCLQTWPTVSLAPGATTSVPVLDGWVDPDGDPFVLSAATVDDPRAPLTVVPTADGRVAIRHADPNAGPATFTITVTVTDARGASATKSLVVSVAGGSALSAGSFAAVGRVGESLSVPIDDHVQGGSGSYRLLDAVASDAQKDVVSVVPNAASGDIVLNATKAGQYVVTYTVQDAATQAEQTAQLRYSVTDGGGVIGMPPLTAFVRAQEDTTVDILKAVENTTGRVLAIASATSRDPGLAVSVIDGAQLRLSGSTADGQPGRVGTVQVVVTDGAGTSATGQVTVFLAQATTGVPPIAIPDAVTVRAGALVDVPVTANDIAPRGEQLELSSHVEGSGAKDELAFASGQDVRYLAPAQAGVRTLRYSVSLAGDPERTATAAITVTVVAADANHPPQPETLVARARAGETVTIPVPTSTSDPDGDATVLSQLDQPKDGQGAASIAPDGVSIRYTAPGNGVPGGQVSFGYTLTDSKGATGTGVVRVAVLSDSLADVAPVTYADAVRAVKGSAAPLTVLPLANDSDPAGGTLKLVSLVPDAPEVASNPEYARLKGLIDPTTDLGKGVVKLHAGDAEGVHAYIYTVQSSLTSSTSQGLIVVTVAPSATAIPPIIADTVVTVVNRSQLAQGLDVVTGKTQWSSGDLDALTLSVWGDAAARYKVDGFRIAGPAPADGALVPFKLAGKDASGNDVVGYGFLRIPALDDMRLQLKAGAQTIKVGEEASTTAHLSELIDVGPGDRLEQKGGGYAVQRANSSCKSAGSGDVTYQAGREAPWNDTCTVLVRVAGQDSWTALPIPVAVQPKAPQAILNPISRTIAPGGTQTIDLYKDLTSWEGGRVGDTTKLDYRVTGGGSNFALALSGQTLTVDARADAHPGARDTATVTVTGFGGLTTTVSLVVGIAPPDAPRPLTFTKTCSVSQGASCTTPVVGIAGEYDPFAGKVGSGLKLVGIGQPVCQVASITMSGTTAITATWPGSQKPAGGSCTVPYTVADAQNRTGQATLTIDVQGYPAPPSSLTTASYTGTTSTLLVDLGPAALAHPNLTGVRIYEHGQDVHAECHPAASGTWSCTVSGLQNGQHHQYTARAVNAVGESLDTSPVESWSYQAPSVSTPVATTYYDANQTNQRFGMADIKMSGSSDTKSFVVRIDGNTQATPDADHDGKADVQLRLPVGPHSITVIPVSQFQPPLGSDSSGQSQSTQLSVAGQPIVTSDGGLTARSNTQATYDGYVANQNYAPGLTTIYAIWPRGSQGPNGPDCSMGQNGQPVMNGGQASNNFPNLEESSFYSAKACSANGFGAIASRVDTKLIFTGIGAPPANLQYTVATAASKPSANVATWGLSQGPAVAPPAKYTAFYSFNGGDFSHTNFADGISDSSAPNARVEYCRSQDTACSAPQNITPATAPTTVTMRTATCFDSGLIVGVATKSPGSDDVVASSSVQGSYHVDATTTTNADTGAKTANYAITFSGQYHLTGTTLSIPYCT